LHLLRRGEPGKIHPDAPDQAGLTVMPASPADMLGKNALGASMSLLARIVLFVVPANQLGRCTWLVLIRADRPPSRLRNIFGGNRSGDGAPDARRS
jgi:hypothetical protein